MVSSDIYEKVQKRQNEILESQLGRLYFLALPTVSVQRAEAFKEALIEYSISQLADTSENKVIVDELGFIFSRFKEQFTSLKEKEAFYEHYVGCILKAYENIGTRITRWQEVPDEEATDSYPRFEGSIFQSKASTPNEESAIWVYREFERKLREKKAEQEKEQEPKKDTKGKTYQKRWHSFF